MAIYLPSFSDTRIKEFCTDAGYNADVDGFYKALCAELGVTSGHIDELWKQYLISRYGYFAGMHVNAYENESDFTFFSSAGHNMVAFDGTNDYLNRGALATGLVDARYGTLAMKIKPVKAAGTAQNILHFGAANARIIIDTSNRIQFILTSASFGGATISGINSTALTTGNTYTIHMAWDSNGVSGTVAYVNGVSDNDDGFGSPTFVAGGTPGPLTWTALAQTAIGASNAGASKLEAQLGFLWFTVGTTTASYITDPTKFYSGGDVNLGTDGTGSGLTQPVIFFGGRNTAADWNGTPGTASAVNKGSGADNWTMAVDGVV